MSPEHFRFGTVGSPISTPKKPGGSVGGIQRSRELGLDAIELGWVNAVRVSEKTCQEIHKASHENQVAISVHAPYFINLNATDDEWPKARKRLMDAARYGFLAGATDIVFHPGSYFGQTPAAILPKAINRLAGCLIELRDEGNKVTLRPETMGKSALLGSLEDTLEMSRAIPGIEPCLDFAHLHARTGDGSMNKYEKWVECLDQYANALDTDALQRLHIHLSGIEYGSKGERNHLPLDEADIDIKAIFRALKEFGCQGRILCESPIMEEDALKMQQTWSELS
jgi:deoxyribonuclease-4